MFVFLGVTAAPLSSALLFPPPPSPSVLFSTSPLPRSSVGGDFNKRWQSLFKDRHIKTLSNVGLTDDDASAGIPPRSFTTSPCPFSIPCFILHQQCSRMIRNGRKFDLSRKGDTQQSWRSSGPFPGMITPTPCLSNKRASWRKRWVQRTSGKARKSGKVATKVAKERHK